MGVIPGDITKLSLEGFDHCRYLCHVKHGIRLHIKPDPIRLLCDLQDSAAMGCRFEHGNPQQILRRMWNVSKPVDQFVFHVGAFTLILQSSDALIHI